MMATKNKDTEIKALRENVAQYRQLVEISPDWVWRIDLEGCHTYTNPSIYPLLGYNVSEIVGTNAFPLIHPDDGQPVRDMLKQCIEQKVGWHNVAIRWLHKDGSIRSFESTASPMLNADGKVTGFSGIDRDITGRKRAEAALMEAEWKFRALFEKGPIGVAYHKMIYNETGKPVDYYFIDANERYQELTGVDPRGKTVTQAFPGIENDPFDWIGVFGKVAQTGETIRFEQYLELNNRWYDCVGYQYKPDHFVAAFTEITERKLQELALLKNTEELHAAYEEIAATEEELRANLDELTRQEQELRDSREKYRSLFSDSRDGIVMVDEQGNFLDANPVYCAMLGYSVEELRKISFPSITPEKWQTWEGEEIWNRRLMKDGYTDIYEKEYVRKDGHVFPVELQAFAVFEPNRNIKYVWGTVRDITERKQQELALHKNTEELHAAYEELTASQEELHSNMDDLTRQELSLRESDEKIRLLLNSTAEAIYGLDMDGNCTFCNASCLRLLGYNSTDELFGRNMHWQIHAKYPDGTHFPVEECRIFQAFNEGEGTHVDDEVLWRSDDTSFPAEYWSYPQRRDGVVVGAVVTFLDITERKRAEEALQRVNQKLNVLSQLTRKDLTNQTFVLSSYLELAKNRLAGQGSIIEILRGVDDAVRLIHETVEYSKDYQDMGAKPQKWQNVKMVFLLGLSHISIGNIQHSLETENLEIFADPLLEKVCQRLFENSVKHGDHVTVIRVWHTVTPDGVTLVFEDDGIGIPQEKKEQIFLRNEGPIASRGSLIFAREILDITGITIRETGEPGKGARFEIAVPKGAYRENPDTDLGKRSLT
jgi:PAS domain S-box-containing protein